MKQLMTELLGSVFTNNYTYKDSPELFAKCMRNYLVHFRMQNRKIQMKDPKDNGAENM